MAKAQKAIGLRKALDMLRLPGHALMLMHTNDSPTGRAYYIVPGGYVAPETAQKIIAHPGVRANGDGLFDGQTQTWKISA